MTAEAPLRHKRPSTRLRDKFLAGKKVVELDKGRDWFEKLFLSGPRPYLWIIFVGLLVYLNTVSFGFTYLDDNILILDSYPFISKLSNVFQAFRQDVFHALRQYDASYRPMLTVSFILDAQLGGAGAFIYHLTNVFLHLLVSCLVFFLLLKLRYKKELSFFFSLIFTIHPILAQAVAWIPGRNDSILALFIISSFIFFLNFIERRSLRYYIVHILFFFFALLAKECAILLAFLCLFYSVIIAKERFFAFNQRMLLGGWSFAIFIWFLMRHAALSVNPIKITAYDMAGYVARGLPFIFSYIGKTIFPVGLSAIPAAKDTPIIYGVIAVTLIITALASSRDKRYNFVFFGTSWLLLFLLPSFIQARPSFMPVFFEHRMYLPIIGFFMILLEIDFIKKISFKKIELSALCLAILVSLSSINVAHSFDFSDPLSFWENAVKKSPHSPLAHGNLGYIYMLMGEPDRAESQFKKALELNPRADYVHNNLGAIYTARGLVKEAEAEYKMEIKNNPGFDKAYVNLAALYRAQSRLKDAEGLWRKALEINPDNLHAIEGLMTYYYEQKDVKQALYYVGMFQAKGGGVSPEFLKLLSASDKR